MINRRSRLVGKWLVVAAGIWIALPVPASHANETVLRRGNGGEPESLDPAKSETLIASLIQDDLFEGLVTIAPDDRAVPGSAESWQISPDGLTYTFKLRPGLRWSNGDPLSAQDYVYSIRRSLDPAIASVYAFLYYPILHAREYASGTLKDPAQIGVTALDPRTLQFRLHAPTAYFLSVLAHAKFFPLQQADVEKWGTQFIKPPHLVSNGAFILKEWIPQSRIVLTRNPYFHDAAQVKPDKVIFLPIDSPYEEINRFRAGEVDITYRVPQNQLGYVRKTLPNNLFMKPGYAIWYLGFNMQRPPFKDNPKLRLALSMVIDREKIVAQIMRGGGTPAYSFVPPGVPGYDPQEPIWANWPMDRRIAEAKRLYAEAGYGPDHPLTTDISYPTGNDTLQILVAIAAAWRDVLGVQSSITNQEFKVFVATRHAKKTTQVFFDGWIGDYVDPTTFDDLLVSESEQNDSGYANPAYDRLVAKGENMVAGPERTRVLEAAERLMLEDTPVAPLWFHKQIHLVASNVHGYDPSIAEHIYSKDISVDPSPSTRTAMR